MTLPGTLSVTAAARPATERGLYSLRGTIGQPAVGVMSGGSYALTGGFWAVPAAKPGDINGDGQVNVVDLLYLADSFGKNEANTGFLPYDDLNDDGNVDVADLLILAPFWGT